MKQPEALELADLFDRGGTNNALHRAAAKELRRLHEENIALRQAIKDEEERFKPDYDTNAVLLERIRELEAQLGQEPVAWIEHHKGGDNLRWEEVNHSYAKATPLYKSPSQGASMTCTETITINADAVNWLKEKYPELCVKAGLCERIAGRLYTKTRTIQPAQPSPVQKPVAWLEYGEWGDLFVSNVRKGSFPVYKSPPSKPWVSLSDEEIHNIYDEIARRKPYNVECSRRNVGRAIEAALRSKNNG